MTRQDYVTWGASVTCKRGEALPQAKLDPDKVRAIRQNRHGYTAKQWASLLGLHIRTIEAVNARKTWVHV